MPFRIEKTLRDYFNPYGFITVETSSVCNVRCLWCFMYNYGKKDMGVMSLENFKKFIDLNSEHLKKKKALLYLQHRGEPLLNKHFFEMVDYAYENGVALGELHTNLSLSADIEKLMGSSIPQIVVNVGGTTQDVHEKVMRGSDFELVTNNIKEMFRLNKYQKRIFLKMNVTKHNVHQIEALPGFFMSLGGDPDNVLNWDIQFMTPAELSKEERKEYLGNIVSEEVKEYLNFTYDDAGNVKAKNKACLYICPTVRWDGKVSICCQDKFGRFNVGDAFKSPLKDILRSEEFKTAVRRGKRKAFWFCKECS